MSSSNVVSVYEVSLRDGLQNESSFLPTQQKLQLFDSLQNAGLKRIEVTSFVNPKWIPALADAEALCAALRPNPGVRCSALIPNAQGFERARHSGVTEVALALSVSETHNKKNLNRSVSETIAEYAELVPEILGAGLRVRAYVSTVWGCPYEGLMSIAASVRLVSKLIDLGCYQVSLGDTIGVATPLQTTSALQHFGGAVGLHKIAMHMHDTRGTALANVAAGLELGVRDIDSSLGGLGGCPYAPGAAGNLCTEDLVYMLDGMGMSTGVDLSGLVAAARTAAGFVGHSLPGKLHQAGAWPP